MTRPRHSFVVPLLGPQEGLASTLLSLTRQRDVPIEVLIQPVGSAQPLALPSMGAGVLVRHGLPQAEAWQALDAGLRACSGDWISFLEPGERLLPGALERACSGAPARTLVSARSAVVDVHGVPGGLELPWPFRSHFEHLAFWRTGFQALPPSSSFWSRELTARLGGLSSADAAAPFYALMCRYTRADVVLALDDFLAETTRLAPFVTSPESFEAHLGISRRHWGSPLSPRYWRCRLDLLRHRARLADRARRHLSRAQSPWLPVAVRARSAAVALAVAPLASLRGLLQEPLAEELRRLCESLPAEDGEVQALGGRRPYADGWAGPRVRRVFKRFRRADRVIVRGQHRHPHAASVPLQLELRIDGETAARHTVLGPGPFEFNWPLPPRRVTPLCVELLAGPSFVPAEMLGGSDRRELSFVLEALTLSR